MVIIELRLSRDEFLPSEVSPGKILLVEPSPETDLVGIP
jgi:hypothetical protein